MECATRGKDQRNAHRPTGAFLAIFLTDWGVLTVPKGTHHAFTKLTVAMDIHQNSQTGTFKKTQGEDETRTAIAAMIAAAGDVEQRTLFTEKPASKSNAEGKRGKKKKVKGKQKQAEEEKKKKKKKNKKKKSKGKPGKDEL